MILHKPINLLPAQNTASWMRRVVIGVYSISSVIALTLLWQITPARLLPALIGDLATSDPHITASPPVKTPAIIPVALLQEEVQKITTTKTGASNTIQIVNKKNEASLLNVESGVQMALPDSATANPTLPSGITTYVVSPAGDRIAYLHNTAEDVELVIAGRDGEAPRTLLRTRIHDVAISWPTEESIAMVGTRVDGKGDILSLIAVSDGVITPLLTDQEQLEYRWAHHGTTFLYSSFDASGVHLWIFDSARHARAPLNIATSAEKCAWTPDDSLVYCGVPTSSALTADVPSEHTATNDAVVIISIGEATTSSYYTPSAGRRFSIQYPIAISNALIFVNAFDRLIYRLPVSR